MKRKFIRIISPITLAVALMVDCAAVYYSTIAAKNIIGGVSVLNIAFAFIMLVVLVVAVLVTKTVLTAGVRFYDDRVEFTAIDSDNVFLYSDIERVEARRDDKISFTKNFNDRHSYVILHLRDEKIATIDLGLTTKKALQKISREIINSI